MIPYSREFIGLYFGCSLLGYNGPGTSTLFHKFCISKWQFEIILYFIHFAPALKSEIRISKHETNSNDRNLNDKNGKGHHQTAFVLNFEHLDFDIVSACPGATCLDDSAAYVTQVWARDFGFRYSYFRNG